MPMPMPAFAPPERPSSPLNKAESVGVDDADIDAGADAVDGTVDLVGAGTNDAGGSDVAMLKS